MSLKEKISTALNQALKEKREVELQTLRLLRAALLNREKAKRQKLAKAGEGLSEQELQEESRLSDEEVLEVLASEVKKRREAISAFEKGERGELMKKEKEELEVLQRYLPEPLTEEALRELVEAVIKETGATDLKEMGKVMAALTPKIKGRAEAGLAAQLVREALTPT